MIRNYFKLAWRSLLKHKFYSLINITGLTLSIGCGIILYQFIAYHLNFDTHHQQAGQIYRVVTDLHFGNGVIENDEGAPLAMGNALTAELPGVKAAFILKKRSFTIAVGQGNNGSRLFAEHDNVAISDANWFKMFRYRWLQGSPESLNEPGTAVMTLNQATKYFKGQDAIGKTLIIDNKYPLKITGVLADATAATDYPADLFISLASVKGIYPDIEKGLREDWQFISPKNNLFVKLSEGTTVEAVNRQMMQIGKRNLGDVASVFHFSLQPLKDVHFDGRYGGTINRSLLMILGGIGMLLIGIACVNFLNMATAQSTRRAKEIGTRRILGSSHKAIFWQFMCETALMVFLAIIAGLLCAVMAIPVINNWLQVPLTAGVYSYNLLLFLVILFVFTTAASGIYPALILSRIKPVSALKNQVGNGVKSSAFMRKALIVGQNVIAQVLIVCTLLISQQVDFLKNANMGFEKDAVVMLPLPDRSKSKMYYLQQQLQSNPAVKNISFCYRAPASTASKGGSIKIDGRPWEAFVSRTNIGDAGYVKTFGLKLIAGRNLAVADSVNEVLVNEKLAQKLGFTNTRQILGHELTVGDFQDKKCTIVGVVKDFHIHSLSVPIEPDLIAANSEYYDNIAVKLNRADAVTLKTLENAWQSAFPQNVFEYRFLDDQIADFYQKEDMINKLIKSGALIAIIISCIGLLGLVSLLTAQRVKEIGVRKVLGATLLNITTMLSKDFIILVAMSLLIAVPVGGLVMHKWLQGFAYRISIEWWAFFIAAMAAVSIALITISLQSVRAALANPVKSLRNE